MRKGSAEKIVRRNVTLPASYAARLEALKARRGSASESEILRQAINIFEAVTTSGKTVVLRDRETGKEIELLVP